jgi:beta-mannosidase
MGRFISEFGMHAAPVYETLRRVIPPGQRFHHSPAMDHHNKDYPKNKGDNLMQSVTGLPHTLDEYIDFSMIAQAEGLKFGVEHYRRRMPHCGGTLVWQLNDCWPGLSWSVLDYYGFGKASYFYLKRAYSPVLASFKALDNGGIELWITNATLRRVHDQISVRLSSFSHEHVWEETELVSVPAQRSQRIATWDLSQLTSDARHFLSVRSGTMVFPQNRHFFVSIQNLQRPVPAPVTTITAISYHQLQVTVHADAYAYFVHARVPYETSRFSDNYVDIEPGEQRTITITDDQRALTPDLITLGWR